MDSGATPIFARGGASEPIVAIALGSGGARGFAHIAVLEALDELGVAPSAIAGTSIGAMIGAAYAAGMSGREIRAYALDAVRSRSEMMGKLLRARVGRFSDLVLRGRGNPVLLDGEVCLDLFWPEAVPDFFEGLAKPLAGRRDGFLRSPRTRHVERRARAGGRRIDGDPRSDSARRL